MLPKINLSNYITKLSKTNRIGFILIKQFKNHLFSALFKITSEKYLKLLTPQEISTMKEIAEIMRRKNPTWGM